ncbi:MAG: VTT domain-containing protein [Pseudomonadota bacterium]
MLLLFRDRAESLVDLMGSYSGTPAAILVTILVFLVGSVLLVPQWALIAASVAAFGLVEGAGIAWLATMVATAIHVFSARALQRPLQRHLDRAGSDRLRLLLDRHSVHSGFLVRLIPTGPAILVNMAAGLLGVGRAGFLAGTAVGIIPKIALTAAVVSEIVSSAQARQVTVGLAVFAVSIVSVWLFLRLLRRREASNP